MASSSSGARTGGGGVTHQEQASCNTNGSKEHVHGKEECTFAGVPFRPYVMPNILYKPVTLEGVNKTATYSGTDIIKLEHWVNPVLVFGQPYSGKTCLFIKLLDKAREFYGSKHWVQHIDMKMLAETVRQTTKRPKCFIHLFALYLKTSEKIVRDKLMPDPKKRLHHGELFLDGFDEIPIKERDYFWRLLPQLRAKRGECGVRIWISCRSHMKAPLCRVFQEYGYMELLKFTSKNQFDQLYFHWKTKLVPQMDQEKHERLSIITQSLQSQLQCMIPDFDNTLGSIPMFVEIIASIFSLVVKKYLERESDDYQVFEKNAIKVHELMDALVGSLLECYFYKGIIAQKYSDYDVEKEFPRISRLHSEFAIKTYPSYEYQMNPSPSNNEQETTTTSEPQTAATVDVPLVSNRANTAPVRITDELFQIGFLVKDENGVIRFQHKTFGDYFLGKFYASQGALETGCPEINRFFLYNLLFEVDAKDALAYFDANIRCDSSYRPKVLHDFLIKHYRLANDQEEEWRIIRNNGNVLHLLILQGFHFTALFILHCFWPIEVNEIRRFLMMRAQLSIVEGNHIQVMDHAGAATIRSEHVISTLTTIALFGYESFVQRMFKLFMVRFSAEELQEEFNRKWNWSPIHYAAIHKNLWFFHQLYGKQFLKAVKITPGIGNTRGLLPLHLLMTCDWYHVMKVKDLYLSDYDQQDKAPCATKKKTSPATSSTSSSAKKSKSKGKLKGATKSSRETALRNKLRDDVRRRFETAAIDLVGGGVEALVSTQHHNGAETTRNVSGGPLKITCRADDKGGQGVEGKEKLQASSDTFRILQRDRDMQLNFDSVFGLMETLHGCMQLLVKSGGEDVNALDRNRGLTVLHCAVQDGHFETVRFLISHLGANPNLQNLDLMTPLHFAGMHGYKEIFIRLTMQNGKISLRDRNYGYSPIMMWEKFGQNLYHARGGPQLSADEVHFFNVCSRLDKTMFEKQSQEAIKFVQGLGLAEDKPYEDEDESDDSDMVFTKKVTTGDDENKNEQHEEVDEENLTNIESPDEEVEEEEGVAGHGDEDEEEKDSEE